MDASRGTVASVSSNDSYTFTKPVHDRIVLVAGFGVEGDVHGGVHVRHRFRVAADPTQPNLRQVHLMHEELFAEVGEKGYDVAAGNLGENITTSGLDLLGLPVGTILRFGEGVGESADLAADSPASPLDEVFATAGATTLNEPTARAVEAVRAAVARDAGHDPRPAVIVAGLRNPCGQINGFRPGLLKEVLDRDEDGNLVRKGGVMGVVLRGGAVTPGDPVAAELPPGPWSPLEPI
jgi:hypothetical protein